jgi:hypothetical protein
MDLYIHLNKRNIKAQGIVVPFMSRFNLQDKPGDAGLYSSAKHPAMLNLTQTNIASKRSINHCYKEMNISNSLNISKYD